MSLNVLFAGPAEEWPYYEPALSAAFSAAGLVVKLVQRVDRPEQVDYVIYAPGGPIEDFRPFTRARAVLSLWAGVERIVGNPTLTQPLTRMVDSGLREGMVEWVTGQVLRHHLGMDAVIAQQDGTWRSEPPPLARDRKVGVLGLGALGLAVARALSSLKFDTAGWSRTLKTADGISTYAGSEGLKPLLNRSDILVALLPATSLTENIVDAAAMSALPRGAVLINPGRGTLIDDAALLAALDHGHLAHATLDVFRTEPLPSDHPFWTHPKVTVSCHVAAATRPGPAASVIAENIRRSEAGEPLLYLVDRTRGY